MFRKKALPVAYLVKRFLRENGLETPLLEKRIVDAWPVVTGDVVARHTAQRFVRNKTLFVKITNAALRSDLSMMRARLAQRLNEHVGCHVIEEVRVY